MKNSIIKRLVYDIYFEDYIQIFNLFTLIQHISIYIYILKLTLTCLLLSELAVLSKMIAEIAPRHYIYYQVQVLSVLEREMHVHQKPIWLGLRNRSGLRMVELCEELFLVHHRVHAPLLDDPTLVHLLHRV